MFYPGCMYEELHAVGLRTVNVVVSVREDSMQAHVISIDNPIEVFNVCLSRLTSLLQILDESRNRIRILGKAHPRVIDESIRHHLNRMRTFNDSELNGMVLISYMGPTIGLKEYVYVGKNRGYNNHDGMWLDVQYGRIGYKPLRCTIVEIKTDRYLRAMAWRTMVSIRDGLFQTKNNIMQR